MDQLSSIPLPKLLIFIVAYQAESTIGDVLRRIPANRLMCDYHVELLIIDDASSDRTFARSIQERETGNYVLPVHVLYNPDNQGYGGNQKIGFHYAIKNSFDYVALIHGDGQYAPERLPELVCPLNDAAADAVFGSRMMVRGSAHKGGMPLYKYVGNKILTWLQNWLLNSHLSEFHSGYRLYSTAALKRIPFDLNSNDFHFDTEIIIQLMIAQQRIKELPISTHYGDETCRVNGMKYAWQVIVATLKSHVQQYGIFYDKKFDCAPGLFQSGHYPLKLEYLSAQSLTICEIFPGARVLDIGCTGSYVGAALRKKSCKVTGIDRHPLAKDLTLDAFSRADLNHCELPDGRNFDYFIMLDVIEHLHSPEEFIGRLKLASRFSPDLKLIVSMGNVAFFLQRLMLLFGQFNYGTRGILDQTHTRLFTFASIRNIFAQGGFDLIEEKGLPAPFPLAVKNRRVANILLTINTVLIWFSKTLFAYQIFMVVKPRPSLDYLLQSAVELSDRKVAAITSSDGA